MAYYENMVEHWRKQITKPSSRNEEAVRHKPSVEGNLKWMATIHCSSEVMCTKFSRDGTLLAAGLSNGSIKVYRGDDLSLVATLVDHDILKTPLACTSISFWIGKDFGTREDHQLIATYASGLVKVWTIDSRSYAHTTRERAQILCSAVNTYGDKLITGGSDTQMHLYDLNTQQEIMTLEASDRSDRMKGHRFRVFSIKYHTAYPQLFVSGGWDNTVQIWDDRQPQALRHIYGPHICGDALDIDAVQNQLLTGSWRRDQTLQIWDIGSGLRIKEIPQESFQKSMIYCCQWLLEDHLICGGTSQNMLQLINRKTLQMVGQLTDLERGVYCLDSYGNSNSQVIAVGSANYLHIIRMENKIQTAQMHMDFRRRRVW